MTDKELERIAEETAKTIDMQYCFDESNCDLVTIAKYYVMVALKKVNNNN